jgi:hypothetical protein
MIKTVLNCWRLWLPLRARASISSGAMSTLSVSGSRETAGEELDFHDLNGGLRGY